MWLKLPTRKSQKFLNCVQKCTGFGLSQGPANCGPQVKCSCCLSLWIQFPENTIKDFDHSHIVAAFKLQWKSWVIPTGTVWPVKLKTLHLTVYRKCWPPPAYVKLKIEKRIMPYCFCVWVENRPINAGDAGEKGSIPGWGRSPRGGNGNPLQHSCLENSKDGGAWWAAVHGVMESHTTKQWSKRACMYFSCIPFFCVGFQIFSVFWLLLEGGLEFEYHHPVTNELMDIGKSYQWW